MQIANVEQAAAWDGEEGHSWAEHTDRYDRASRRHLAHLLQLVQAEDQIIDIGCGCGAPTRDAARIARSGSAVGVDLSGPMLAVARERAQAEGLTNVEFIQADAQVHPFPPRGADLVISSFGAMFFGDPVAAFTNIGAALHPGGRLALLAWRELDRNEWLMTVRGALALGRDLGMPPPGAPTPFSLADPDIVRDRLGASGFVDLDFAAIDEPIDLGTDGNDAFEFMRHAGIVKGLLHDLDDGDRAEGLASLRAALAAREAPDGVLLGSSAWLITARRA